MSKIKAILHDWDDTITDSFNTYKVWYSDFAKQFGLPNPDLEVVKRHWGKTLPGLLAGVWPDVATEELNNMLAKFMSGKSYDPPLFYGVKSAIKKLHKPAIFLA